MATLDNLTNLITNAKSTPSGKIEWTDASLKGIQQEVEYLFSQNAIQVVENTTILSNTINDNSQLVFVTSDPTLANNGIYFWNLTAVSTINFPAGSNGFWNLIEFGVTSAIAAGYIPYSNGSNLVASYLRQTTNEIKMMGGSFVANNSLTTGPYFQAGDTDATGNKVVFTVDDKNQLISTKKNTSNKGIKLDFANNIHKVGDIDASRGLSVDTATPVYKLGDYSSNTGVVINLNNGYIGNPTWGYVYNATTLVAGNASINLTLDDSQNSAILGDATKGLFIDLLNTIYSLGTSANGLVINTTGTYTLGNGTKGLDLNTTTDTYKLSNGTKGLYINTASDSYKLGNYTSNIGVVLGATTGYLGSATFGYNYTATNLVMGNASVNVTLDDTSNTAYVGTNTQGLLVDITNSLYKLGDLSTSTGLSLGTTTGYLGSSTFGYNYTATTMIAGNSSVNLTLNDSTDKATLGTTSKGVSVDLANNVLLLGTSIYGVKVDIANTKIQLNGTGFGFEVWDTGKIVRTINGSGLTEGLYVDLFGSNYTLGGSNASINISNTGKTIQTNLNGVNVDGLKLDYTADSFLIGGAYATKSAAIGVYASQTATPQMHVGSDLVVTAVTPGTQTHKVRIYIPGVGVRYIPVYS